MDKNLIYMPTFRYRQEEAKVLSSFEFGENIYPLIEIIKEFDRARVSQKSFEEIYLNQLKKIKSNHIFVDLPIYINQAKNVKLEVNNFILKVINNLDIRCKYLNSLSPQNDKIIPVISSYFSKNRELDTVLLQEKILRPNFKKIAFRIYLSSFEQDVLEIQKVVTKDDFIIFDIDKVSPHRMKLLSDHIESFKSFKDITKILLRSALNTDIENTKLEHGKVVLEADNSHMESGVYKSLGANCVGDYVGIKKDNMTEGGSISPGFIYFDSIENQFYGFKAVIKDLDEFKDTIIPAVLNSQSTDRMLKATPSFLTDNNFGYKTLLNINSGGESGKNQAKFKRISMEHYLFCIKTLIGKGSLKHENN